MLTSYPQEAGMLNAKDCKPDPEDMLQSATKRLKKAEDDIQAFNNMGQYYFPDSDRTLLMLYGAMHIEKKNAEDQVEYWLKEIDKE